MTIQEYNDIYKNPIVKSMEITSSGGVTITNTNICMEQMSLEESLCSENSLVFGACESGCFKIRIADLNHNFEGEWLTVNQLVAIDDGGCLLKEDGSYLLTEEGDRISLGAHDNAIPYGRFKVFSDKPTNDRRWRDLVCYDAMYDILNAEVIDWYNGLTFPMTMKNFRDSFFTYLGITQETTTLVNDSFMIQGGFSNEGSLSGKTIITSICELNGVFGHISRQGEFEYISLPSADSLTLDWYMDGTGAYEDYTVQKITGITAKSSEEDVGTTVGTDTNVYIVQDNPLIYGSEGTQGLTTALTNLLNNVKDITYRPFNVNTYGNPMLPLGTNLTITTRNQTINSFLMTRVLSGIQSLKDSISADGEQYVPSQVNSLRTETKRTKGKIHELVNNVDELRSTISDLDERVESEIQQLADTIVLKVDANGNIVKVELSANPSTGSTFAVNADNISFTAGSVLRFVANNILIDSTYFKVDQYGNLTSTSGTIGGWEINSNGLMSEHDYTSYSTYMNLSSQLGEIEIGYNTDVLGNSRIKIDSNSINFLSDYANSGTEYNVLSINYTRGTTGDVGNINLYDNYDNRHVSIGGSDGLRIFDNNTTKTHVSKDGFYDSSFLSNEVLVTNSSGVIVTSNISTTKLGYLSGVTSDIQTQLNGKQATITGGATTIVSDNLTASKALVSNANGKVAVSSVSDTELGYLSGATSNIQGQIDDVNADIDDTLVSASGNPITITDAANIPCESLTMTIEPIQSGSGTPSTTNVRPITGLTEATVQTTNGTNTNTATISFGGDTIYSGTVDFNTGIVTVTKKYIEFDGSSDEGWWISGNTNNNQYGIDISGLKTQSTQGSLLDGLICDKWETITGDQGYQNQKYGISGWTSPQIRLNIPKTLVNRNVSSFKTYLSQNPIQVVCPLATPQTIQLTPSQLTLLKGNNTVSANGNTISLSYQKDNAIGDVKQWVEDNLPKEYYTTTEQKTNKVWIDGKPIYQITLTGSITAPSSSRLYVDVQNLTSLNIDTFISAQGFFADGVNIKLLNVADDYPLTLVYNKQDKKLRVIMKNWGAGQTLPYTITILYTKA